MRLFRAFDLFDIKLAEDGRTKATRTKYVNDILYPFGDLFDPDVDVREPQRVHCREYLGRWAERKDRTYNLSHSVLNVFFEFTIKERWRERGDNPMEGIGRRKLLPAEFLDVVTVDDDQVGRLFAACEEIDEFICAAVLIYTGVRRSAAGRLRWRDLDLRRGTARFYEKGKKVNPLPLADELHEILYSVALSGKIPCAPDDYVIPNRASGGLRERDGVRYRSMAGRERSPKVVYKLIDELGERAGVEVHPHALRAAFAVHYYEQEDPDGRDRLLPLKDLLGHARLETTEVYLRRRNKERAKETVRSLSWASVLQPSSLMPPAGFEPAFREEALPSPLKPKLDELLGIRRDRARR